MEHLQVCWVKAMLKAKICETFGKGLESANSRTDATPGYFENSQQSNRLVSVFFLKQTVLAVAAIHFQRGEALWSLVLFSIYFYPLSASQPIAFSLNVHFLVHKHNHFSE